VTDYPTAHAHRIIGSAFYDLLIILGLLMIAGFIAVGIYHFITGKEAIPANNLLFQLYLLSVISGYFLYFWKHSGQTVGMKAWRIKLVNLKNESISVKQLVIRQLVAIPAYCLLFIGVLWQYWDKSRLSWHDHASSTKLIYIPKKKH
jgi:uncharacterized RDD family membrane protein YckC